MGKKEGDFWILTFTCDLEYLSYDFCLMTFVLILQKDAITCIYLSPQNLKFHTALAHIGFEGTYQYALSAFERFLLFPCE
jgi:hypothetical protein